MTLSVKVDGRKGEDPEIPNPHNQVLDYANSFCVFLRDAVRYPGPFGSKFGHVGECWSMECI